MRRVICFILVMALMMCVPFAAFATDVASPSSGSAGGNAGGNAGNAGTNAGSNALTSNPRTGDTIIFFAVVMLVALIALVAAVVIYRKKFAR